MKQQLESDLMSYLDHNMKGVLVEEKEGIGNNTVVCMRVLKRRQKNEWQPNDPHTSTHALRPVLGLAGEATHGSACVESDCVQRGVRYFHTHTHTQVRRKTIARTKLPG